MSQPVVKHWALLGYLVFVWGFAFALIAVALKSFHPLFIVWCRLWMGALVMWCVWRWRGGHWDMERSWWSRVTLLSLTGNIIPFSLIAWAEQSVPSAEVGILMALMPIATLVLAHWLLEHEPLTRQRLLGVVMGFLGVALLVGDDIFAHANRGQWQGQLAALVATLSYAFNGVYAKRMPAAEPITLALGTLTVGSVIIAVPAVVMQASGSGLEASFASSSALVLLGMMGTGIATWCYFVVVSERGPGFLSTINYLIPAVAFAAGTVFLAEPWGWEHLLALLLILVGVGLIQVRKPAI
ncbi:MAG: DMT family transporter [Luminiphilus sp.]|jgi:drug/metabolite transporter (DMT)-like permease|nr:DMT family transporter [Luminiphilus sp.]